MATVGNMEIEMKMLRKLNKSVNMTDARLIDLVFI